MTSDSILFPGEDLSWVRTNSPKTRYRSKRELNVPAESIAHSARDVDPESLGEFPRPSSTLSYCDLNPLFSGKIIRWPLFLHASQNP